MPILISAAAASIIFSGSFTPSDEDRASFLNPASLRDQLKDKLQNSPNLAPAMTLADELVDLSRQYNAAADTTLEHYQTHVEHSGWSAGSIADLLKPLDEQRLQALNGTLRIRRSLLEVLTKSEWTRIFG